MTKYSEDQIKEIAEHYLRHTVVQTAKKFKVLAYIIFTSFKDTYGVSKRDYINKLQKGMI